jgi:hypothetical protein
VVVDVETGRPCGWRASFSRSVLFVIPGANVAAAFLEMRTIIQDPHGLRLGDRFALTQVVEGYGARDLIRDVMQYLVDFIEDTDRRPERPEKVPVKVLAG